MTDRITFYVGLGLDRDGQPIKDCPALLEAVKRVAAWKFEGFSLTFQYGGWNNPVGELVIERSMRLEVLFDSSQDKEAGKRFASYLRERFNQDTVLMTVERVELEAVRS